MLTWNGWKRGGVYHNGSKLEMGFTAPFKGSCGSVPFKRLAH